MSFFWQSSIIFLNKSIVITPVIFILLWPHIVHLALQLSTVSMDIRGATTSMDWAFFIT